jgi:hypothetical protein
VAGDAELALPVDLVEVHRCIIEKGIDWSACLEARNALFVVAANLAQPFGLGQIIERLTLAP